MLSIVPIVTLLSFWAKAQIENRRKKLKNKVFCNYPAALTIARFA